jgi:transcriptional regulator with XRE-family HTH domain
MHERCSLGAASTKIVYRGYPAMSTKNVDFNSAQCRAARALLDMTQSELAAQARLGLSTVVDFERERREVSSDAVQAIQSALRRAGVEFIEENGGGPGVRLRKRRQK